MPSKKPTFKKPREVIEYYEECTWLGNDTPMFQNDKVSVFYDKYPVVKGHLLFVPKKVTKREHITICFEYAWEWGVKGICDYKWEAFNVGINNGEAAGQTVMWPHVHMIPRRKGDTPNPRGGIRNVIPQKADYVESIGKTPIFE